MKHIIKNDYLAVTISDFGAELQSVVSSDSTEFIWQGDENFWTDHAPVVFPICGRLKDGQYIFEDNKYEMGEHGFAYKKVFEVKELNKDSITYFLKDDEDTYKQYPFNFELEITYKLEGNTLVVNTDVINTGKKNMYFSAGSHEGYACPEGIEDYKIIFEKTESNLKSYGVTDKGLIKDEYITLGETCKEIQLKNEYFEVDGLVFKDLKSRAVTLTNGKRTIDVNFKDSDFLLIWTMPDAKFVCIEPWCGMADSVNSDYEFTKKEGIISLKSNEKFNKEHKITFQNQR